MSEIKPDNTGFSKEEKISDDHQKISISEMAEMISIYYDEIKAIAKNLEEENCPLPAQDIEALHKSLLEYARIGAEFTEKLKNRTEDMDVPGSKPVKDRDEDSL